MDNYKSAYENYYKNINNVNKDRNKFVAKDKRNNITTSLKYGSNKKNEDNIMNYLIKRITRELTGSIVLLLFFIGLKYIPLSQVEDMYVKCKQTLNYNFSYNDCVNAISMIKIGNIEGKDMNIKNFTMDDFKIEDLKTKASNFVDYIKQNSN